MRVHSSCNRLKKASIYFKLERRVFYIHLFAHAAKNVITYLNLSE